MCLSCGAMMNQKPLPLKSKQREPRCIVGGQYIAPLQGKVFTFLSTFVFICFLQTTLACSLPSQNSEAYLLASLGNLPRINTSLPDTKSDARNVRIIKEYNKTAKLIIWGRVIYRKDITQPQRIENQNGKTVFVKNANKTYIYKILVFTSWKAKVNRVFTFKRTMYWCGYQNYQLPLNVSALLYLEKNKNEYRVKQRIQKTNQYLPIFFQALGKPLQTF
jgi:hypothetical protein